MEPSGRSEVARVVALSALAFLLMMTYGMTRPPVESLFLEQYTSRGLPWVWLAGVVSTWGVVTLYVRLAARIDVLALLARAALLSALVFLALLSAFQARVPHSVFVLYVVKDIFAVVLVEAFWSYSNLVFRTETAKKVYGLFCVMGSLGGLVGNLWVGVLAGSFGTLAAVAFVLPVLLAVWAGCSAAVHRGARRVRPRNDKPRFVDSLQVVRKSDYLGWMVLLIATVQVVITLVDFQYNQTIERAYPATDARTRVIGQVYAAIDFGSIGLQLLTVTILRVAGVSRALLAIPVILSGFILSFVAAPGFWVLAALKIASKCLDYSVFRAAKEILYIPLAPDEKVRGKAVVDILTYRVAKGGASMLIQVLVNAGVAILTFAALPLIAVWLLTTAAIIRRYRARVALTPGTLASPQEGPAPP